MTAPALNVDLTGTLLDRDDDEFRRLKRSKADHDIDDAQIDIVLRRRLGIDFDEIGVAGFLALKCALPKEVVHEGAGCEADLSP